MRQGTWTTSLFWIRERQQLITKEAATEKNLLHHHHPHPLCLSLVPAYLPSIL